MNKLSVLIPVYNTPKAFLLEAVRSVQKQNINIPYEILLVDDGSTKEDTQIALAYLDKQDGVSIHCLGTNMGTSAALNKGHELLTTEYIAIMGSDDISDPNRFKLQMDFIAKNPTIDVVGTNLFSFYDDDIRRTPIFTSSHKAFPTLKDSDYGWLVNHGTVIYKNKSVKDVGGYDLGYRRAQDVNLWKRMAQHGKKFANIPQVLYAWRRFR